MFNIPFLKTISETISCIAVTIPDKWEMSTRKWSDEHLCRFTYDEGDHREGSIKIDISAVAKTRGEAVRLASEKLNIIIDPTIVDTYAKLEEERDNLLRENATLRSLIRDDKPEKPHFESGTF